MKSSYIWIPKPYLENKDPIDFVSRIAGFYTFTLTKPGFKPRVVAEIPNMVVNAGLDLLWSAQFSGGPKGFAEYCAVGTGNTAVTATDTTIETLVASTSTWQSNSISWVGGGPYWKLARTFRFTPPGSAYNIAEVTVGAGGSGTSILSRALVVDGVGSPTTFAWQADETLDVTYELRSYAPTGDDTGTMTISGSDYDYTVRASFIASSSFSCNLNDNFQKGLSQLSISRCYTGTIQSTSSGPTGSSYYSDTRANSYNTGDYYIEQQCVWQPDMSGPSGTQPENENINSFLIQGNPYSVQIGLDSTLVKNTDYTLTINSRSMSWANYVIP